MENQETFIKTRNLIIGELIAHISVFLVCFLFLFYKAEKQNERIDDLYKQYVDAKKDLSDYRRESDQKFYDLLRDKKENVNG